ncbi:hypothetical protein K438DRAFT_1970181 [Mycena galopus ATCC 62051]|nr:hypothetical protein K438DRAFT_1970181 [Mycena galopus ATCC 62051]
MSFLLSITQKLYSSVFPSGSTPERRQNRQPRYTRIHGDWYTDTTLSPPWSTNWEEWESIHLFKDTVDGKLMIDKLFKDTWEVSGKIEPLAYILGTAGLCFLFTAGGRYYLWSDGSLTIHRTEFASPKEFLHYALTEMDGSHMPDEVIPMRPGTDLEWWW